MLSNVRTTRKDDTSLFNLPFPVGVSPEWGTIKGNRGFWLEVNGGQWETAFPNVGLAWPYPVMGMAIYSFGTIYFFGFFCAKLSGLGPSFGLWGDCWFMEPVLWVGDGLGSESLFRAVHSGLGSKQQHLGSMQHGGFCGQQWGFCGQQWGFGGQQWGFGGQQGVFGGHGLHFGCSHIFQSFGGPRKKRRTFQKESWLPVFISPFTDPHTHPSSERWLRPGLGRQGWTHLRAQAVHNSQAVPTCQCVVSSLGSCF